MKRLPRFLFVSNPDEGVFDVIMETTPPYLLGKAYGIPKKDQERVEAMMADIANDRTTAVKIPGLTMFLTPCGSLTGEILPKPQAIAVLRDMADFYLAQGFERKKHKHRIYQEDVPDDIDEQNGRRIREAERKIYLPQK